VIPPEQDGEFVARMEDVLDVYCRPYDARFPVLCVDEQPRQLIKETRATLPASPGRRARFDYEYERNGTATVFMASEPLAGRRKASVRERRTAVDWAREIRELLDVDYPSAEKVVLVCDNLNTHKLGSLYEAFEPEEARRLARRLEIHCTPKHGSWLNIAEVELSALARQCLSRRMPDIGALAREVKTWEQARNANRKTVDWQFKTEDARIKLKRLYPQY
jgi:hypothetical protein